MERKPAVWFVVLVILGCVLFVVGFELLDTAKRLSTVDRVFNVWVPIALMASGLIMVLAGWRLLRFATLGTLMIAGGMAFMWMAPSLRPLAGPIFGGVVRFLWAWLDGEPWRDALSQFMSRLADALAQNPIFHQDLLYQDMVFVAGGLGLTAIGAGFVVHRAMGQAPRVVILFEETDGLGARRTIVREVPRGQYTIIEGAERKF